MASFIPTDEHDRIHEPNVIDFAAINKDVAARAEPFLAELFPNGKRSGDQFRIGSIEGDTGTSLCIDIATGKWCDHADERTRGGDFISLYAAKYGLTQKDSAIELSQSSTHYAPSKPLEVVTSEPPFTYALTEPPFSPPSRRTPIAQHDYRDRHGNYLGAILRHSTGAKVEPWVWTANGWLNKGFNGTKPLYMGELLKKRPNARVLIVEGEKCADAANKVLTDGIAISWPCGSAAVDKADWHGLESREVVIWPDNDEAGDKAAQAIKGYIPHAKTIHPPTDKPKGWDIADAVEEGWSESQIVDLIKSAEVEQSDEPSKLLQKLKNAVVSRADRLEYMREQAVEAVEVMRGMSLLGQGTVLYMTPNGGKTLIAMSEICRAVQDARIDGSKVYYILADDTYSGAIQKGEIAREVGFNLVIPESGEDAISLAEIPSLMDELSSSQQARGVVLLLDTLKKVCSMMQKAQAAEFGKIARKFIQAGGTIIALAHTNKHKGDDGKAIHEGTGDIVADLDCAFIGELDTPKDERNRQITFTNLKLRGPVKQKVSFTYDSGNDTPWLDKFKSVKLQSEEAAQQFKRLQEYHAELEDNYDSICWVYDLLNSGAKNTTEIKKADCPHVGRSKMGKLLERYADHPHPQFRFWTYIPAPKNAKIWSQGANDPRSVVQAVLLGGVS